MELVDADQAAESFVGAVGFEADHDDFFVEVVVSFLACLFMLFELHIWI